MGNQTLMYWGHVVALFSRVKMSQDIVTLEDKVTKLPGHVSIWLTLDAVSYHKRTETLTTPLQKPQNLWKSLQYCCGQAAVTSTNINYTSSSISGHYKISLSIRDHSFCQHQGIQVICVEQSAPSNPHLLNPLCGAG